MSKVLVVEEVAAAVVTVAVVTVAVRPGEVILLSTQVQWTLDRWMAVSV
jgi:hypothetical protein